MDRYWRELERQRQRAGNDERPDVEIRCPLGPPPARSQRGPRWSRIWQKYAWYPWRAAVWSRAASVDTVHVLDHSYAHLLARVPRGVRKIATVHDLAPLRDPSDLTASQSRRFRRTVDQLHRADLVLADSRHSADEAVALLGLDPAKLRVLLLGVHAGMFTEGPAAGTAPPWLASLAGRQVILSVGHVIGRKNLQILPAVFRQLRPHEGVGRLTLVRVGTALPEPLRDELRSVLGPDGLLELGRAPDAELAAAYGRADALVFPSRQEGFGFPVLEAMAAGCPVVCTNVTSLPEVGGEAALYFGPDDPGTAAEHLRVLLTDPGERAARVAAGREQAASLSWERHYEQLLEIYRGEKAGRAAGPQAMR